jgi:eukaryotic-like serine/threonine-protein kinase
MNLCPQCSRPYFNVDLFCAGCGFNLLNHFVCRQCGAVCAGDDLACSCGASIRGVFTGKDFSWGESRFFIRNLLGEGGTGSVYRGIELRHRTFLRREVALKFNKTSRDEKVISRFQNEASALFQLASPCLPKLYDLFWLDHLGPSPVQCMVVEYIPGQDLTSWLRRPCQQGPRFRSLLHVMLDVCEALQEVHSHGLLHRDVKPSNILVREGIPSRTRAYLVDFGSIRDPARRLTEQGTVLCTPLYGSPEQIQDQPMDGRTDIFSLGASLYHCMMGQPPFLAPYIEALVWKLCSEDPPFSPNFPSKARRLLLRALAKTPQERFQSVPELGAALLELLRDEEEEHLPSLLSDSRPTV